jgi:hypothetical protein
VNYNKIKQIQFLLLGPCSWTKLETSLPSRPFAWAEMYLLQMYSSYRFLPLIASLLSVCKMVLCLSFPLKIVLSEYVWMLCRSSNFKTLGHIFLGSTHRDRHGKKKRVSMWKNVCPCVGYFPDFLRLCSGCKRNITPNVGLVKLDRNNSFCELLRAHRHPGPTALSRTLPLSSIVHNWLFRALSIVISWFSSPRASDREIPPACGSADQCVLSM